MAEGKGDVVTQLTFQGNHYELQAQESVLDCLLRHGITVPNSCHSGICQTCLMKLVAGRIPEAAQQGLKPAWREQGLFLACACRPEQDIEIDVADRREGPHIGATVVAKDLLSDSIVRLRLACDEPYDYLPGQFINIQRGDDATLIRSYSLASVPVLDQALEIHVRRVNNGRMSSWLYNSVEPGQQLTISRPQGECYYQPGHETQGLLLLATGCGLAPLWGILRDALQQGHKGPIYLFHGALAQKDLYLDGQLRELQQRYPQFSYFPCLDGDSAVDEPYLPGRVQDQAVQKLPDLKGWRVYLCGNPAMVADAKRKAFLAGAMLGDIHADPFVSSPP